MSTEQQQQRQQRQERITDLEQTFASVAQPLDLDGLSYEQYFEKVGEMLDTVRQHWAAEQRVKSLKVVIQLAKLLADTSQLKLCAKKYRMITDFLDEFGRLVYRRIHALAEAADDHRGHERARDTCRNWFLKVASIRELVPRFYTEISILKSCDILLTTQTSLAEEREEGELLFHSQTLMRLTRAAWGFGDPLVALHARAYLCRVADQLIGWDCESGDQRTRRKRSILFEIVRANLRASVVVVSRLDCALATRALRLQTVSLWSFFELMSSSLQSICNTITQKDDLYTNEDELSADAIGLFDMLLSESLEVVRRDSESLLASNIVLHSIIRSMPASIIAKHRERILEAIQSSHETWAEFSSVMDEPIRQTLATFYPTLESLALALEASREFEQRQSIESKRAILTFARKIMDQLALMEEEPSPQCTKCFKAWVSYCNHFLIDTSQELDNFLNHFIELIKKRQQQQQQPAAIIVELIKVLMSGKRTVEEFRRLFAMRSFNSLFDLLGRDDTRFEAVRLIFETMRIELKLASSGQLKVAEQQKQGSGASEGGGQGRVIIEDKRMIEFIRVKLFAIINDSLGLLADEDDTKQLAELIILFLNVIHLPDFNERLDFLSKCRSSLANLNPILEYLSRQAYKLAKDYLRSSGDGGKRPQPGQQEDGQKRAPRGQRNNMRARRNFLNGCLAFTYVTIPALHNPPTRLDLLLEGAHLALENMSLSLADYYMKQLLLNLSDLLVATRANFQAAAAAEAASSSQTTPTTYVSLSPNDRVKGAQVGGVGVSCERKCKVSKSFDGVARRITSVLDLMLEHQDYIDLRYRLALSDLIEVSFSQLDESYSDQHTAEGLGEILKQAKHLKLTLANNDENDQTVGVNDSTSNGGG